MPRIERHKNWTGRNIHWVTGVVYMLISLVAFLADADGWWRVILLSFFPVGLVQIGLHFWYARKKDVIFWDEHQIGIIQQGQEPISFHWEEVEAIKMSQDNLTIKSGEANGMMVELKGYKKEEVKQLQAFSKLQPSL